MLDWKLYQYIIFNVIQNAIKYNKNKGSIEISVYSESSPNDKKLYLVTDISNTGEGID